MISGNTSELYEFGSFTVDPVKRLLLKDGSPVALSPKAFDALLILIENSGRVVERNELIEKLWPDTFVEEINLNVQISLLRKSLGEQPNEHRYIVTVPRKGYSFVAEINRIENGTGDRSEHEDFTSAATIEDQNRQEVSSQEETNPDGKAAFAWPSGERSNRLPIALSLLALIIIGITSYAWLTGARQPSDLQPSGGSIAILPFKHLTSNEDDYLGVGIADALITKLSNIDRIIVRPTSAVLKYSDAAADPMAAGRELEVDLLLEGKIQRAGDRIRVTVQMLRMRDGAALWADSFDESYTNIFGVEDSISRRVAEAVKTNLNVEEKKSLVKHYTENTQAYQAYIRGRYHWNKRTGEELIKAIGFFEEAIERDPGYGLAYAGLADSYNLMSIYGGRLPKDVYPKAKEAAMKAIELDDTLAEAHTSLAYAKMRHDWDWAGAEADFKRALDLAPGYATAHHWYGEYLMLRGRADEAKAAFERALELNPLSVIINSDLAWVLYYGRDYDAAINQSRKALELDRDFIPARLALANAYAEKGMYEEALAEFGYNDIMKSYWFHIGYILAKSGKRNQALRILNKNEMIYKGHPQLPHPLAVIHAGLGDKDRVIELLEEGYRNHLEVLLYMKVDPRFDSLRSDERFQDLLSRIGLN
ncbi:MAG: winged helix-turn-helix domain-containing protein [Blastocatellia bacterium]|nr:winged helix-turn-helix domain-containing protein [Blastocatellia bacterium]